MSDNQGQDPKPPTGRSEFDQFCAAIEEYTTHFVDAARRQTEGEDFAEDVRSTAETFRLQWNELLGAMRSAYARASSEGRADTELFLKMSAGVHHAKVSSQAMKKGFLCKIIEFMQKHLQEIKKIVEAILEMLHLKFAFLEKLLLIIDELWNLIASIFCPDAANKMSRNEVNFLNEMYAARRLTALRQSMQATVADE